MDEMMTIRVKMADCTYPLTIPRGDAEQEAMLRQAAKEVDEMFNAICGKYQEMPKDRLMAMIAFQYALAYLREKERNDANQYVERIERMKEQLDSYLQEI
jgi:cell division protein ZapA (FtsZ GTPase activity inhibitor)